MNDISIWRALLIFTFLLIGILAWKSPELLKAFLDYKKNRDNDE